jgi:hypothetical protein
VISLLALIALAIFVLRSLSQSPLVLPATRSAT